MRSGTRSACKSRYRERGKRPQCKVKPGYDYCYLYAAVQPFDGRLISLLLPADMTQESFGIFIEHFKTQTQATMCGKKQKVLLITGGAGSHQEAFLVKSNITLQKLPAASPELNPAERFFEELRKEMSNQVFDTLEAVEDKLCEVLQRYYLTPNTIISLTTYPYLSTS